MRLPVLVATVLALLAGTAAAQKDKERADSLFKQGKKLMSEKHYNEACQAFEESFKLDPGIGTELNVAKCYEEWGKLRRAYRAYQQADQMAKDSNDSREPKIADLIAKLEPQVPKLTIKLPAGASPSKLSVQVDGEELDSAAFGKSRRVDPGPHTIEWTVDNGAKQSRVVPVERGGNSELVIDLPGVAQPVRVEPRVEATEDTHKPREEPVETSDPGSGMRIGAYVAGGVGLAAIGVASYLAFSAHSQYTTALSQHCGDHTNMCDPTGLSETHDARSKANLATGVFIGGAVVAGAGIVLFVLAPHATHGEHALRVVPQVDGHHAGFALDGRF
jgi:hypothetical protein